MIMIMIFSRRMNRFEEAAALYKQIFELNQRKCRSGFDILDKEMRRFYYFCLATGEMLGLE
jgi:hypothetical protein